MREPPSFDKLSGVDFLLECVGFPPDQDYGELIELAHERGESVPWRGPSGEHLSLHLAEGIELRFDREEDCDHWSLLPYYRERQRLRVAVRSVRGAEDSPFDALLIGWAAPSRAEYQDEWQSPGAYLLACWLTDARRLPRRLLPGRVLSVGIAGFALEVSFVGPNADAPDPTVYDLEGGARLAPLASPDDPGGCMEASLRVKRVRHVTNPLTGLPIMLLECDAPERSLHVFLSPWQLERDGLPAPRPGWRVEGVFLFMGRITGGLPGPSRRARKHFG